MLCEQALNANKLMETGVPTDPGLGNGIIPRNIADGRCVNAIVFRGPSRRANGSAAKFDSVARILVVKNSVPKTPGSMP